MNFKTLIIITFFSCLTYASNPFNDFQEDADLIRLKHLADWTKLFEDYKKIKKHYPLQNLLKNKNDIVLVKIASKKQMKYLSIGSDKYRVKLDNNKTGFFNEYKVKYLINELESVLKHNIKEIYDIQQVPTASPIGYNYFVTKDGYLMWVTCITCGTTQISTLLMDGFTPTVNIASKNMVKNVTKALERKDMINHPLYKKWMKRKFHKEKYVSNIVNHNHNDSKE